MLEPDNEVEFSSEAEALEAGARYDREIKADLLRRYEAAKAAEQAAYNVVKLIEEFRDNAVESWNALETRKYALEAIMARQEPVCEDCGHKSSKHGTEGCTHERGDSYTAGFAPVALGPCGCQTFTIEDAE